MNHLAMGHSVHGVFPVVAILGGVVAVATILWLVFRNRVIGASGLSEHEKQTLSGEEADLLAMLRQKGGPMTQPEICENTGRTPEDIACLLQAMEDDGLIRRDWQPEAKAYTAIAV